jgi:hypothetical protein
VGRASDLLPPLHVGLDVEKILETDPPGLSRSGFQHEASELGMEDRGGGLALPCDVNILMGTR